MARALILALGLGLCASGPVMGGGLRFPVISDWVLWRVSLTGPDVVVELADRARVTEAMAAKAGGQACRLLGREFTWAKPEAGQGLWTYREACR